MSPLTINTTEAALAKSSQYPDHVWEKLALLRGQIITVARACDDVTELQETLKWGELSYLTKKGSTIRMDWKPRSPEVYCLYFKCTSKLIPTFKTVFGDIFTYETNRALQFGMNEEIPLKELSTCIEMALRYHSVKDLSLLGHTP